MKRLTLFTFIDALGWEVLRDRNFLATELPHRRKLRSVLGYSSACVPSILSGNAPRDHGHWSFYFAADNDSPFTWLKWLRFVPFNRRGRVRHQLSKLVKKLLGWTGYFQLYSMPLDFIDRFDYCEKNDIFAPGGMNQGSHIFDELDAAGISYHVSDWHVGETENMDALQQDMASRQPRFAFLYMAAMDALLHDVGKHHEAVDQKLAWYEQHLRDVLATAHAHYDEVDLFICSDHGMATVNQTINLKGEVEAMPWTFGRDYLAAYDSTMARFWFRDEDCRREITAFLETQSAGRILSAEELRELGCDFHGAQYGETVFLLDAGTIICPSHMGETPVTGMHGYHPDDPDSDAVLLSSKPAPASVGGITDLKALMLAEAQLA